MMNIDRLTQKAQAVVEAQKYGCANKQQEIDLEHLHLALIRQNDGLIGRLIHSMDIDVISYEKALERKF